jgi:hypothetical protein
MKLLASEFLILAATGHSTRRVLTCFEMPELRVTRAVRRS